MKILALLIASTSVAEAQPERLGRLGVAAGGTLRVVTDASYDALDGNDRLGLGRLEVSWRLWRLGLGELVVQAAYQYGEESDAMFDAIDTRLLVQAGSAGARYRVPLDFGPVSLAPLVRADLGAYWASVRWSQGGDDLSDRDVARGVEALGGLEVWIHPVKLRGLTGRFAYGAVFEAGYAWIGAFQHDMRSDAPKDAERLERHGADPGPLDLSGAVLRAGAILRF